MVHDQQTRLCLMKWHFVINNEACRARVIGKPGHDPQ